MTADDQTRQAAAGPVEEPRPARGRLPASVRRGLLALARPYARHRAREAETAAAVGRLQSELEHVSERHTEQIERLESLVSELVITAENLRRGLAEANASDPPSDGDAG